MKNVTESGLSGQGSGTELTGIFFPREGQKVTKVAILAFQACQTWVLWPDSAFFLTRGKPGPGKILVS